MRNEIKISLPFYKIAYAVFFVVVLSLVRGITHTYEIGIALETSMAILAAVFCADTYAQEIVSKRAEIQRLYPMKNRLRSIIRRTGIQELFLILLSAVSYGLFYLFQKPTVLYTAASGAGNEMIQFAVYLAVSVITIGFWGVFANTLSCIFRNMWFGIGGCLVVWIIVNSKLGDGIFGAWNLFSYTFRPIENSSDVSWVCGKLLCVAMVIMMLAMLPKIVKKRG